MILIEKGKERNSRIVRAEADTRRRILRIQSIDHCEQDHLLYRPIYILIYSFLLEMKVSQLVFYKLTKELEEEYENKFFELKEKYEKKTSDLSDSESYLSGKLKKIQ